MHNILYITPPKIMHATSCHIFLLSNFLSQNNCGETPLHFACQGFWPAVAKVLLEAGADVTLLNLVAANPFLHAIVKGFY